MTPRHPAAAVHSATLAGQQVVRAPLDRLAKAAEGAGVGAPAVVVVGAVVDVGVAAVLASEVGHRVLASCADRGRSTSIEHPFERRYGNDADYVRTAPGAPLVLLATRRVLSSAERGPAERFRLAHLAALRTAAACSPTGAARAGSRRRLLSAWVLLERVAPEFGEWAAYFAAAAPARAAVEAGATSAVSRRDADDQLRAAQEFLALVEASLGLLPARLAS